jgi:hypothetical protein
MAAIPTEVQAITREKSPWQRGRDLKEPKIGVETTFRSKPQRVGGANASFAIYLLYLSQLIVVLFKMSVDKWVTSLFAIGVVWVLIGLLLAWITRSEFATLAMAIGLLPIWFSIRVVERTRTSSKL